MERIKHWPLSVKLASIVVLLLLVAGMIILPAIIVPLLIMIVGFASALRIAIYFVHGV